MKRLISLLVILCFTVSLLPVFAEDSAVTRDELVSNYHGVEQSVFTASKSEFGYCSSGNSSTLAWAASYMLESYAEMYKNTGDKKYLKSLGVQLREAFSNLNHDYGEDKPGWDAPNYSIKRINATNSAFNSALVSATSDTSVSTSAWMRKYGSSESNVTIEANAGKDGKGLHIKSGDGKIHGVEITIPEYAKGTIFQFSTFVKNAAPARAYITTADGTILKALDESEYVTFAYKNGFKNYVKRFKVPEDGEALTVHIESSETDTEGDIYVDTVLFQQAAQFHVHDTMMLAAGAKFVEAVYLDEDLSKEAFEDGKTYKEIADEFLTMIETLIEKWDFCWREEGDIGVYIWPMDDSSSYAGNTLPHNQYIKMACVMMPLYNVTKSPLYLDRATKMLNFFKSCLKTEEDSGKEFYHWNYYDPAFDDEKTQASNPEDISHGCLELDAAIMAYERGILFDEADMKKFANAFVVMLWNGDVENPVLYNVLTNNPSSASYHKVIASESNVRDWARLGKWNPQIPVAIVNFLTKSKPTSGHPTKMLAYSYAFPYIYNPIKYTMIESADDNDEQIEGNETPASFAIVTNEGIDETILENTSWIVKKDGSEIVSGTGETFTFTPDGPGTYSISATINGFGANYTLTVNAAPEIDKDPEGGDDNTGETPPVGGEGTEDSEDTDAPGDNTPSGGGGGGNTPSGGGNTSSGGGNKPGGSFGGSGGGGGGGGGFIPTKPKEEKPAEEVKPEKENKEEKPSNSHKKEFNDVKENAWYHDAVNHVVEKGYMNGVSDSAFRPQGNMTRAMLAKVLHNMKKNPETSSDKKFSDVKTGEWYTDAILWAAELGIVTGYGNGNYGTNDNITREQLAVMLWRFSDSPDSDFDISFADADKVSPWAIDAMRWAVENGIINGKSNNTLSPETFATRAEVAQMLKNYSKIFKE